MITLQERQEKGKLEKQFHFKISLTNKRKRQRERQRGKILEHDQRNEHRAK